MKSKKMQRKVATAVTISSFFITGITGLLIFFELASGSVRAVHEWMSIVFVLGACGHIFVNIKMFKRYFTDSRWTLALVLTIGVLTYYASYEDVYMADHTYNLVVNTPIERLIQLNGVTTEQVESLLNDHNLLINSWTMTLTEVATLNNLEVHYVTELMFL